MDHFPFERRQDVRFATPALSGRLALSSTARIVDLGLGGAKLETHEWLAPGRRYPLRLQPGIQLSGFVVRCALVRVEPSPGGGRAVYEVGVSFGPLPVQVERQLQALLADVGHGPEQGPVLDDLSLAAG